MEPDPPGDAEGMGDQGDDLQQAGILDEDLKGIVMEMREQLQSMTRKVKFLYND